MSVLSCRAALYKHWEYALRVWVWVSAVQIYQTLRVALCIMAEFTILMSWWESGYENFLDLSTKTCSLVTDDSSTRQIDLTVELPWISQFEKIFADESL